MNIKRFNIVSYCMFSMLLCVQLFGENFYIDQNNPRASDFNPGTKTQPWQTIVKANQVLSAGDTVFIRQGTYRVCISPIQSGQPAAPIVYASYDHEQVIVSNDRCGVYLNGKTYIVIRGIHFSNMDEFLWLQNSSHNTIEYCVFDGGRNVGWSGSRIFANSMFNWIHHCQFSNYGYYDSNDNGSILDIGDEESRTDYSNYNLLEDNVFFHGGHHILGIASMYNVIRRNYFHNEPWSMGTSGSDRGAILYGNRNVYFSGYPDNSGRNLFEENRVGYAADPPDNVGAPGMALSTSYNIVRFNEFFYNNRAGLAMTATSSYYSNIVHNKIYNNTFFYNGLNKEDPDDHMNSGIGFGLYSGPLIIKFNTIKNNVLYKHRVPYGYYHVDLNEQYIENNWNGDERGDPRFVNADVILGDPFDPNYPDLQLLATSPCRDAGTYLTTILSPSGSGTSFLVQDAGYFMDGWGIVKGDSIQLYGGEQTAIITHVDYNKNEITVDRNLTWMKNQGICLAYVGTAPDMGAFEFGRGSKPRPPVNLHFITIPPK